MDINYDRLPEHMRGTAKRYIEYGINPGSFLSAVICNDLFGAYCKADWINEKHMRDWIMFFYNDAPYQCFGSREAMDAWMKGRRESAGEIPASDTN